jgi:hypothetical protein
MSGLAKRLEKVERELTPPEAVRLDVCRTIVKGGQGVPTLTTRPYSREELATLPCLSDGSLDDDKIEWFPANERGAA